MLYWIVCFFFCFVLAYAVSGILHWVIDQHSLPFATYYRSWMPGNYTANGCNIININDNFHECQIYNNGEAFIYVRIDKYTGQIKNTTFSFAMGALSQFLYQYGEPNFISFKDGWHTFYWNHLVIHLYGDYSPSTIVTLATYF